MTVKELYEKYGSSVKISAALGVTRAAVVYWKKIGYIPLHTQRKIEFITDGQLKASSD